MSNNLGIVILAAGQGTRMRSARPKVLHSLADKPLLRHVIDSAQALRPAVLSVVYGHGGETVPAAINDPTIQWVEQREQLGTGHAVEQALPTLRGLDRVLVLYGDVPLISAPTLARLLEQGRDSALALLTVALAEPFGYGRIVRDARGAIQRIVEQKDATEQELEIRETNTGMLCADRASLERWIARLDADNAQGEYYLTDIVELAVQEGTRVQSAQPRFAEEVMGVNDRLQLAMLERHYQRSRAEDLMRQGLTLRDPYRFDLRGSLEFGPDAEIDINVLLEGQVSLGEGAFVGANSVVRNSRIGAGVQIKENCVIEDAVIGEGAVIGPFARIRPDTDLAAGVHIGNFVEIKKSSVGRGSKINHLSYVGDSEVGRGVNIGAGTITCNYDGANKHKTVIGDDAFIGSDTQLVAPVTVGRGATIGAGSTITRDTPDRQLTLSRPKQQSLPGWKRPVKTPKGG